jgi:CHAT domain-containing protein
VKPIRSSPGSSSHEARHCGGCAGSIPPSGRSKRSREIRIRLYGEIHPAVASSWAEEGGALLDLDRFEEARTALERALAIDDRVLGPWDPLRVYPLNLLSTLEYRTGDVAGSLDHLYEARDIAARAYGPNDVRTQPFVYNIGVRLVDLSEYAEAAEMFEQASAAFDSTYGPKNARTAMARMQCGAAKALMGDTTEARIDLQRALAGLESGAVDPGGARVHAQKWLAYLEGLRGRYAEAGARIDRALALERKVEPPSLDNLAALLQMSEFIAESAGDTARLARTVSEIAALADRDPPPPAAAGSVLLAARVRAEMRLGLATDAWAHALVADSLQHETLRMNVRALPDRQALALGIGASGSLEPLVQLAVTGSARERETAWDRIVRRRGLVTAEVARRRAPQRADSSLTRSHDRWITAQQAYAQVVVATAGADSEAVARRQAALERAENAEREFARLARDRGASLPAREPGLADVRASLPKEAGLVSVFELGGGTDTARVVAFVAPPGGAATRLVRLGTSTPLQSAIDHWRASLAKPPSAGHASQAEQEARRLGVAVRERAWDPLAQALGTCREIYLVSDGPLLELPWHALPVGTNAYLVEREPLVHELDAERDLADRDSSSQGGGLLALGSPSFDSAGNDSTPLADVTLRGPLGKCQGISLELPALPAAKIEVEEAGRAWNTAHPNEAAEVLVESAATEVAFKRKAPGRSIVHLATHGIVWGDSCAPRMNDLRGVGGVGPVTGATQPSNKPRTFPPPPGFERHGSPWLGRQVWLALAGAHAARNGAHDANEGLLTAQEVAVLDLRGVDWVLLSACQSGVGRTWPHEGAEGMRRAFRLAGARTVIASQWSLADEAAREWVRDLYAARGTGIPTAAVAMRDASRAFLASRRERKLSTHPFYWAAFRASGR